MTHRPSIGRIVHYVSYGTPGGEYTSKCRAAFVIEVAPDGNTVGLVVLNPSGAFFHSLAEGGCEHHETYGANPPARRGGTWHWPEQI